MYLIVFLEVPRFGDPYPGLAFGGRYPLHLELRSCKQSVFQQRFVAKSHVRRALIVVPPPCLDLAPVVVQTQEPMHVQTLVPERPAERFNERVVCRLPGRKRKSSTRQARTPPRCIYRKCVMDSTIRQPPCPNRLKKDDDERKYRTS